MTAGRSAGEITKARRRPRGAVRDGLIAAGLELAQAGGPDAVVLREATQLVGVVPKAAYRHFADRDELLAAVCAAAMRELAARMAAGVARVRGKYGDPAAARRRLGAVGRAYLEFARDEPGLFAITLRSSPAPSSRRAAHKAALLAIQYLPAPSRHSSPRPRSPSNPNRCKARP